MTQHTHSQDAIEAREADYWDQQASHLTDEQLRVDHSGTDSSTRLRLSLLGDLSGKRVLDVGCGTGFWSVLLAQRGAEVWSIDISPDSVAMTSRRASLNGVAHQVHASVMSAVALEIEDAFFDAVHGQDIIHHVDAAVLGREIARVLAGAGRAVFSENSANNAVLMFARNHLCGRWGIPKWSSDDEYPLTGENVARFGQFFSRYEVRYPEFLCLHYVDAKLFQYRHRPISRLCYGIDRDVQTYMPFLRRYSYRQLIFCIR